MIVESEFVISTPLVWFILCVVLVGFDSKLTALGDPHSLSWRLEVLSMENDHTEDSDSSIKVSILDIKASPLVYG